MKHKCALLFFVTLYILTGCNQLTNYPKISASNPNLVLKNGILYYNEVPLEGRLVTNFDRKTPKSEIAYRIGRKNGKEMRWHADGSLAMERFYTNGYKTGIHKAWWQNGKAKFTYHFNDKGEYNGTVKEWYISGQPYRSFNYVNGQEKGSQRLWKKDGSIKANYEVRDGDRFGLIGLKKCFTVTLNNSNVVEKTN